jgi:hypothetical protein
MNRSLSVSLLALSLLFVVTAACGHDPGEALAKCRALDDVMERAQCYDQLGGGSDVPASELTPSSTLALRKLEAIPDAVNAKGPAAWGWKDRNGDNVFVITYADQEDPGADDGEAPPSRSRSMVITHHVVGADGKAVRKRTVKDFVNGCAFDVHLHLEDGSLQATDLDGDGFA